MNKKHPAYYKKYRVVFYHPISNKELLEIYTYASNPEQAHSLASKEYVKLMTITKIEEWKND